jgi:hypothetical protein
MLRHMNANKFCRIGVAVLLAMAAVVPALANTQFRIRRMMRNDVPPGKGQCDIRLQVDQEAEVSVRGETVSIKTIAGRDPRDDGSECNAPLPSGDMAGFNFEVKDSRGDIRLISEPSRRTGGAAVVYIRDSAGGEGRYHFRISWMIGGAMPPVGIPGPERRQEPGFPGERRGAFRWDDTIAFRGEGRGTVTFDRAPQRLFGVNVDIDRRGRIVVSFRMEGGRTLQFTGTVVDREPGGRLRAEVVSDDRFRAHGMMFLSVDNRRDVNSVTLEAENGRDRMRVVWDRR